MEIERIAKRWPLLVTTALVSLSAACVWWIVARADRDLCDDLLQHAQTVARSVNQNSFRQLTGTSADLSRPEYQQLKEQFCAFRVAYPRSRFIYLLGRTAPPFASSSSSGPVRFSTTNNPVFFYVDSEDVASKDYSPPGMIYSEVNAVCYHIFDTQKAKITRYTDRWGKWVSAFVPLLDPQTGKLLAVLGTDIDAGAWYWDVCVKSAKALVGLLLALLLGLGTIYAIVERKTHLTTRKLLSHSFATKILLSLCLIAVLASLISSWPISQVAQHYQLRQLREWLKALAETSAAFIDGDQFARLTQPDQHGNGDWQTIANTLRRFQQNYPDIRYIYAMRKRPDTDQSGVVQFVVDPTPEGDVNGNGILDPNEAAARLGEPYNARQLAPRLLDGFTLPTCDDDLTKDQWGQVLSGYAPIHNAQGAVVGLVGIDLAAEHLATLRHVFLWQCLIVVTVVMLASLIVAILLSRHLARPLTALRDSIHQVASGDLETRLELKTGDEFEKLSEAFNAMTTDLKDRAFMRTSLTRFMNQGGQQAPRANRFTADTERRRITLLVCDVPALAALADTRAPEDLNTMLKSCYGRLIACVLKHGGIINQLRGDGLTAIFGAPLETEKHEQQALRAAIEMQQAIVAVRAPKAWAQLQLSIGIHTDYAVVGNLGSYQRSEYTALGHMVQVATQLGAQAHTLQQPILISQNTAHGLDASISLHPLEAVLLAGQTQAVPLFSVDPHA